VDVSLLLFYCISSNCRYCVDMYVLLLLLLLAFSPWASLAGTRAQSGDRYGSGMLHSGQVLRGSLPLFFPAFRCSHFHRQMPLRPPSMQALLVAKGGTVGENGPVILPK
jgi:hypothetical protein